MAKIKKNYSINEASAALLASIADRLNKHPGDVISEMVALYGTKYFQHVILVRSNPDKDLEELHELEEIVLADLAEEDASDET